MHFLILSCGLFLLLRAHKKLQLFLKENDHRVVWRGKLIDYLPNKNPKRTGAIKDKKIVGMGDQSAINAGYFYINCTIQ